MSPASHHRNFTAALALAFIAVLGEAFLIGDIALTEATARLLAPLAALITGAVGGCILLLRLEKPSAAHPERPTRYPLLARIPRPALLAPALLAATVTAWLYLPEIAIARATFALKHENFVAAAAVLDGPAPARLPEGRRFERAHLKGRAHLHQWELFGGDDALLMTGWEAYREALRIYPGHITALGQAADVLDDLGAHAEALQLHDRAVDRASGYGALLSRGASHRALGEYDAALADADAAVAKAGKEINMPTHYHRGRTLFAMGRYAEADAEFLSGLRAQSNYSWVYTYMGCGGVHLGKYDQALEDYTKGVTEYEKEPPSPTSSAPPVIRDHERLLAELVLIRRQAKGETLSADEIDGLCRHFHPEIPIRDRSPLLPAKLDLGADDED